MLQNFCISCEELKGNKKILQMPFFHVMSRMLHEISLYAHFPKHSTFAMYMSAKKSVLEGQLD